MLFFICLTQLTWPDLEKRGMKEVCTNYARNYKARMKEGAETWTGQAIQCEIGTQNADDRADTVRRVNFFRFLSGLTKHEVKENVSLRTDCMQAAAVLSAIGRLDHYLNNQMPCYTEGAGLAARNGNLAMQYWTSADTIDGYMQETGVPDLGHRRWIIYRSLAEVGVGWNANPSGMRMGVLDVGRGTKIDDETAAPFVAYPGPGAQPWDLIWNYWSVSNSKWSGATTATGSVTRDDGKVLASNPRQLAKEYGEWAFAFDVQNWQELVQPNREYTVEMTANDIQVRYVVKTINCTGFVPPDEEKMKNIIFGAFASLSLVTMVIVFIIVGVRGRKAQ